MNSFIDVTYSRGTNKVTLTPQYQYNNGQKLRIKNINDDVSVTVHYAVRGMVKPIARIAEKTNDVWISAIPNVLMAQKSPVQAFVYLVTSDTAQTVFEVEIPILERPMPDGYEIDDEEINNIELMIEDLKKTIVKAESVANITASAKTLPSGSNATAAVTETNGQKELEFGIPMGADGKPGGYYSPVVSDDGMLSWTASNDTLPPINDQKSIIGPEGKQGNSGVFYGPEEPTDPEVMVWIDEDGAADAPVSGGGSGATFIPSVSEDGTISWTNNGGLANPSPVNIKGPQGEPGKDAPQNAYTPDNQPPYPVTSVAGKTGDVKLTPEDVGAQPAGEYALKSEVPAAYTLPVATADTLGGVKSSEAVTVNADGTMTVNQLNGKSADEYALKSDLPTTAADVGALAEDAQAADSAKLGGVAASEYAKKTDIPEDMGGDADTLGGKAPEYYIQPLNLLDNSDFRNPVNQRGQTSYSTVGYTIDRWYVSQNSGYSSVSVNNGIEIAVNSAAESFTTFLQYLDTVDIAKKYTFAVCDANDNVYLMVSVPNERTEISTAFGTMITKQLSDATPAYGVTVNKGTTFKLKWAALYEGEYTADNLPPYTPKENEQAMCLPYFERFGSSYSEVIGSSVYVKTGAKSFIVSISFYPKRIDKPSIKLSDPSNYRLILRDAVNGSVYSAMPVASFDEFTTGKSCATFRVNMLNEITQDFWVCLQRSDDATAAYIDISSDL